MSEKDTDPYVQEIMTCLIEEAAEVIQAVTKAQRFGLEDGNPAGDETNRQALEREIGNFQCVVERLANAGVLEYDELFKARVKHDDKLSHYLTNKTAAASRLDAKLCVSPMQASASTGFAEL